MDFTYYIPLKNNEDTLIKSIRIVNEKTHYVLTIYYYYMSIEFNEDKNNIIYNWSKDHKLQYHQDDDPFDWHIHIRVKTKEDVIDKLKKLKQLKTKDINNLKNLLSSYEKSPIKNVKYDGGTNDIKMYKKLKKIMKKERFDYEIIKDDVYDKKELLLVFYFLRFSNLQFKISPEVLDKLSKNKVINSTVIFDYNKPLEAAKAFEEYRNLIITAFNDYKNKKRKVSLEYYINLRLTVDLAWNLIQKNKIIAYFLFNRRFQNCFYELKCKFKINLNDSMFKNMLERVDKKLKTTTKEYRKTSRGITFNEKNPNFDGGNPANI